MTLADELEGIDVLSWPPFSDDERNIIRRAVEALRAVDRLRGFLACNAEGPAGGTMLGRTHGDDARNGYNMGARDVAALALSLLDERQSAAKEGA